MNDDWQLSRREFLVYACGVTSTLLVPNANAAADLPQPTEWHSPTPWGRSACCSGTGAAFGTRRL